MAQTASHVPSPAKRLISHPWARLALPLLSLALLLGVDIATGPGFRIGGLMVAVPALSAGFLGPGYVLIVVAVTLPCVVVAQASNNQIDVAEFPVAFTTVVLISAASVAAAAARQRRDRELAQARWVAAITQRALLRPLPRRLGALNLSTLYMAADKEATIGGDIYAAAVVGKQSRVMIGDVQGKGLAAVETAGYLLSAFRRSARKQVCLRDLPEYLDRSLREDLTDTIDENTVDSPESAAARRRIMEGFVTAVMVDFAEEDDLLQVVNRGHPPPLLIHDGTVRALEPKVPALPLGLGDLDGEVQQADAYELRVGDTLLLYTDGVVEARDRAGVFYPLADRLARWTSCDPGDLLGLIRDDLIRHAGARLADDVAMVVIHRGS
jgi:serine phosphatase RsbU (regulator of sigma subunit)